MTNTRDDFSKPVRHSLALRAGHVCSFPKCAQKTVGPSDISPTSVAMIGAAAHIHAAAPGGARYLATMTSAQRRDISNGIWMCRNHATLVDCDEITYRAETLRAWKVEHEERTRAEVRNGSSGVDRDTACDLVAIGFNVIATGQLLGSQGQIWRIRLDHFVEGDVNALVRFGERFAELSDTDRFVIVNALGDGRVLASPPKWQRSDTSLLLELEVHGPYPREPAQSLGADLALDLESRDLRADFGIVSGVNALPQKVRLCFWNQRGHALHPEFGSRLEQFYKMFRGSPWLERLIKVEAIRLAAIPYAQKIPSAVYTPFHCVERVRSVVLVDDVETNGYIMATMTFDVLGVGEWIQNIPLYVGRDTRRQQGSQSHV